MAITRLGGANAITGTIPTSVGGTGSTAATLPASLINNTSIGNVTALPAAITTGTVLQVVSAADGSERSTSSSSFSNVVSASITPSATSSKILIVCGLAGLRRDNGNAYIGARVTDGASFTKKFGHAMIYNGSSGALRIGSANASFLHSANTTSSKTYTVQFNSTAANATIVVGDNGDSNSTITLMEIAG